MPLLKNCPGFRVFYFSFITSNALGLLQVLGRPPCLIYLSTSNEVRPREQSNRGRFLPLSKKASSYGVRAGCHYIIGCVCVTLAVFIDCESCTRPISTNPGSMEAGEYGLTRGTCVVRAVSSWSRSPGCY